MGPAHLHLHGLGLRDDFLRVTPETVTTKVHELLTQPYYKLQARRMMQEFMIGDETRSPARAIEMLLG